jgi:hypothetical protein
VLHLINIRRFHKPLMDAGLVPLNCKLWEISIGVAGALTVRYEVFLTAEQLVQLGGVFQAVGASYLQADAGVGDDPQ